MANKFINREIDEWKELIKTLHIEVLKIYNSDFKIEYKGDKSPVTKADKLVSEIINKKLIIKFIKYFLCIQNSYFVNYCFYNINSKANI